MTERQTSDASILQRFGVRSEALLGRGGEAVVYALDSARVLRICCNGTTEAAIAERNALLNELARAAASVPFAIPEVLDMTVIEQRVVTIERRLDGRSVLEVLAERTGSARETLVRAYLEASAAVQKIAIVRPWYGELLEQRPIRTATFREYLAKRASRSLLAAGIEGVDAERLANALPEPSEPSLVHLDAFPGNMLSDGQSITALIDFGGATLIGDSRLDPLSSAVYLDPAITPTATTHDEATARQWLLEHELYELFAPTQRWLAAYWSFATDQTELSCWCRRVLCGLLEP